MQFESHTLQFISPYYFEIREIDEDKYKAIVTIFGVSILLPNATFLVFVFLAFIYSDKISTFAIKQMRESRQNTNGNNKHALSHLLEDKVDISEERDKRIMIFAISIASVLLTLVLFAFHITASIQLIDYGNEVLYNRNVSVNSEGEFDDTNTDDQVLPVLYVAFSFFPTVVYIILIAKFMNETYNRYNKYLDSGDVEHGDECLGAFLQYSIGGFLVYLGFYYLPFMVLAFINDPIQTVFIYVIAASFILCVYLLVYSSIFYAIFLWDDYPEQKNKCKEIMIRISYATFAFGSGLSIAYFLIIVIFVITLGSFHNFQAVENLTLPIIIALITIFIIKPSYKFFKTNLRKTNTAKVIDETRLTYILKFLEQNRDLNNQTTDTTL